MVICLVSAQGGAFPPHPVSARSNMLLAIGPGTFRRMNRKNMRKGREEENEGGDERKEQRV